MPFEDPFESKKETDESTDIPELEKLKKDLEYSKDEEVKSNTDKIDENKETDTSKSEDESEEKSEKDKE